MGMIDMSEGEADYLKYRFKQYLGSVSREIQNRRLKEQKKMGMTIDKIIQGIEVVKAQAEWEYPLDWQIVLDGAIETMRKYQKIEQAYSAYLETMNPDTLADLISSII